jgi:hypothetical protein
MPLTWYSVGKQVSPPIALLGFVKFPDEVFFRKEGKKNGTRCQPFTTLLWTLYLTPDTRELTNLARSKTRILRVRSQTVGPLCTALHLVLEINLTCLIGYGTVQLSPVFLNRGSASWLDYTLFYFLWCRFGVSSKLFSPSHFLLPHWSKNMMKKLCLLSIFSLVNILFNKNAWNNFGEGVRGTRKVEKHWLSRVYSDNSKEAHNRETLFLLVRYEDIKMDATSSHCCTSMCQIPR